MSWIENASGSFAAPCKGVRREPSSTRPHADAGRGDGTPPPPRPRGRLRNDPSPGRAGRQLSPGPPGADYLGHPGHFQEPKHDPKTRSGSLPTAASSRDRLVLGGPSFPARVRRTALTRGRAVVL